MLKEKERNTQDKDFIKKEKSINLRIEMKKKERENNKWMRMKDKIRDSLKKKERMQLIK